MQLIDTYNNFYQLYKEIKMTNDFKKLLLKKSKILIFGRYGQLGSTFYKYLSNSPNVLQLSSKDVNFLKPNHIRSVIDQFKPKYIINTAAYTDVNGAESNINLANKINCDAVKILAECSKINNSILIHFSTDYVFDGKKQTKYKPTDITNPNNEYGRSKLKGEQRILESGCNFFIFRISWLVSEYGNNFIKTIISKLRKNDNFSVVDDQIGSPISTDLVSKVIFKIMENEIYPKKVYHLSTRGEVSWYDIAIYISRVAKNINKFVKINPIKSYDYKTKAIRPKNSLFDLTEIENITKEEMPFWKDDIKPIIKSLDLNN